MRLAYRVVIDEAKIAKVVKKVKKSLGPDVVRIRFNLGEDWDGSPSIFFRTVITDEASDESRLRKLSIQVRDRLREAVDPSGLDLNAYFNFRNVSEQAAVNDPEWD